METPTYDNPYGIEGIVNSRTIARQITLYGLSTLYSMTGKMNFLARNRVQFIYLHHLFAEEEEAFRNLIWMLAHDHCLINYSEAVERVRRGNIDRPYVCFSFDDGLKQCLRAGQILKEFGISGCFFLCPSYIGETDPRRLKEICETRFGLPAMDLLSWKDVDLLLKEGHEIGSHTMNHLVLSKFPTRQIAREVIGSREIFERRIGGVKHFAWPEGQFIHFNATAAQIVFNAGYDSCASAERGCHISKPDLSNFCIRRDYISASWPLCHVRYFLARNSLRAKTADNGWPQQWSESVTNMMTGD